MLAANTHSSKMLNRFAAVIRVASRQLSDIADVDASRRPQPGAWSAQEELGHLIDSAINNYARIIRVQREESPSLPGYEQDAWVERAGYQEQDWKRLVALWAILNTHMLSTVGRIAPESLTRMCTIAAGPSITLEFLIEDYVDHMVHHLQHIGIALSDFRRPESVYA